MEDKLPLVSVVIPTYNRAKLIGESIKSVIDQTYRNWEMIVVDDGSSDNTKEVIDSFQDVRISYNWNVHKGVLGAVRNLGMRKANGTLVAFLDSDDIWRSDKLEFQVKLLMEYDEASFVFSNANQFGKDAMLPPEKENFFIGKVFLDQLLHQRFCFYSPTLIFKKDLILTLGCIDESFPSSTDIYFFYRMAFHFIGIFTNERLVMIRKEGIGTSSSKELESYENSLTQLNGLLENQMISPKQFLLLRKNWLYKKGLLAIKYRKRKSAFQSFLNFIQLSPLNPKGWFRLVQSLIS